MLFVFSSSFAASFSACAFVLVLIVSISSRSFNVSAAAFSASAVFFARVSRSLTTGLYKSTPAHQTPLEVHHLEEDKVEFNIHTYSFFLYARSHCSVYGAIFIGVIQTFLYKLQDQRNNECIDSNRRKSDTENHVGLNFDEASGFRPMPKVLAQPRDQYQYRPVRPNPLPNRLRDLHIPPMIYSLLLFFA